MRKADNQPPYCAVVKKSGSLNFLEPSWPARPVMGELYLVLCHKLALYKNLPTLLRFTCNMYHDNLEIDLIVRRTVTDCARPLFCNL